MTAEKNRLERVTKERDAMRDEQQKKETKYHEVRGEVYCRYFLPLMLLYYKYMCIISDVE